jgi:hypothetical protein
MSLACHVRSIIVLQKKEINKHSLQYRLVEKVNLKSSYTCLQNLPSREHVSKCITKFTKQAAHHIVVLPFVIY